MTRFRSKAGAAAALAAAALYVLAGCDGDDDEPAAGELALWLTKEADYRLATVDTSGDRLRVRAGGEEGGPTPALFARPAWSPDGSRIAFAGVTEGDPATGRADVFVMDADGSGVRQLTRTRDAAGPVWSSTGGAILFSRLGREDEPSATIWSMRPDGTGARRLTLPSPGRRDLAGAVTPGGARILYTRTTCTRDCEGFESSVFLMGPDGRDQLKVADDASDPALSPDGRRIAFVSDRDRNGSLSYGDREFDANELYVMNADGTGARRLTRTRDLNEAYPTWSPDGRRIAFQRGKVIGNAEGTSLHQTNADGTCERAILTDPRLDTWYASPAWRPDSGGGGPLEC